MLDNDVPTLKISYFFFTSQQQQHEKNLLSVYSVRIFDGSMAYHKANLAKITSSSHFNVKEIWKCCAFFFSLSCWGFTLRLSGSLSWQNHNIFMPIYGNVIICINRIEFRDFPPLGYLFPIIFILSTVMKLYIQQIIMVLFFFSFIRWCWL